MSDDADLAYVTLAAAVEAEIEVKRSRFLARLEPVEDEAAAREVIEAVRRAHRDAVHHCSAFVLVGEPGGAGLAPGMRRSNDDGEPSGTAGAPMLDALDGAGLTGVVAVVTRWFGGTLLGTGGLARAYGDAVTTAADGARRRRRRLAHRVSVDVPVADVGRVENELRSAGFVVAGTEYAAVATLHLDLTSSAIEPAGALLAAATGGAAAPRVGERFWADAP